MLKYGHVDIDKDYIIPICESSFERAIDIAAPGKKYYNFIPKDNGAYELEFDSHVQSEIKKKFEHIYRKFHSIAYTHIGPNLFSSIGMLKRNRTDGHGSWHRDTTEDDIPEYDENFNYLTCLVYLRQGLSTQVCISSQFGSCDPSKYRHETIESTEAGDYVCFDGRLIHRSYKSQDGYILWFFFKNRDYREFEQDYPVLNF